MKKKSLRILAGSVAIFLIALLIFVTNSFVGNPISKMIAKNAIHNHVEENFANMDLEITDVIYSFKFGEYIAHANSPTSEDTNFSLTYRGGNVVDNYEMSVLDKWNTYSRIEEEYSDFVKPIIEENFPYEIEMLFVSLIKNEEDNEKLTLDMEVDFYQMPLSSSLSIFIYETQHSWEKIAKIALELNALLEKNRIEIDNYSIVLSNPKEESANYESLGVYDFPKSLLQEENLADTLKAYFEEWSRISEKEKEQGN